jgi:hypothetical protein
MLLRDAWRGGAGGGGCVLLPRPPPPRARRRRLLRYDAACMLRCVHASQRPWRGEDARSDSTRKAAVTGGSLVARLNGIRRSTALDFPHGAIYYGQ